MTLFHKNNLMRIPVLFIKYLITAEKKRKAEKDAAVEKKARKEGRADRSRSRSRTAVLDDDLSDDDAAVAGVVALIPWPGPVDLCNRNRLPRPQ